MRPLLAAVLCVASAAAAQDAPQTVEVAAPTPARRDLTQLSLSELSGLKVTSVSKKPETWLRTAAAVVVITADDIRRSGARSLPELLRLAPGVHVARIDSSRWAIGIRGFTSALARAQLALIDGRSLYTPLFAGTYWDVQDVLLEDVERIEVIRGPGGTLWGANAVNGVINVITKRARDTRGGLAVLGAGDEQRGFGDVRYGGGLGRTGSFRAYGKYSKRDPSFHADTGDFDGWHKYQGGFRTDWDFSESETLTVQGDVYRARAGQRTTFSLYEPPFSRTVEQDGRRSGGNLRGRWKRAFDGGSELSVGAYYDRTQRREAAFREDRDTLDFDAQYRFRLPGGQEVVAGVGYRSSTGRVVAAPTIVFDPATRRDDLFTAFVDDTLEIVPGRLRVSGGAKVEWNDYTHVEVQPSLRLSFTPGRHAVWLAATRAVRTPSRIDRDLALTVSLSSTAPVFARLLGDDGFDTESATVYEAGYRGELSERALLDVAGFHARYPNQTSYEIGAAFAEPGRLIVPFRTANGIRGRVSGIELAPTYQVSERLRLRATYAYLNLALVAKPGSTDAGSTSAEDASPRHQAGVWSYLTLPGGVTLDASYRWVARLPSQDVGAYSSLDVRLAWRASPHLEIAAVGRDLLRPHHAEFGGGTEVERSAHVEATGSW